MRLARIERHLQGVSLHIVAGIAQLRRIGVTDRTVVDDDRWRGRRRGGRNGCVGGNQRRRGDGGCSSDRRGR
jgi:hypothetical protein